ncbi:LLM class flavin-dependent oxidoreductase [Streptomyces palmae]|uniref:LLM class flavin-dependent oxidoreductase n=1 Tax=Streptomyces palmae TaxID=1701085 RepID=A0A4Z0HB58_9ACTN|nr:LLM class flavin-dependent oxidoreductase [Streptomyces palmae]TGB06982.1 LLM class flavin-dependent oxidoreductase [Streptomyces palmae]
MPVTVLRLGLVDPDANRQSLARRYGAAVEMAGYADEHGITMIQTEEHHGGADGWQPSPLAFAGAVLGATRQATVTVCALIAALYDPLRLAEDIAVLDLTGGGRLVTVAAVGDSPREYTAHGRDWARRGPLQDEALETLLAAWSGKPFRYRGHTVRITPRPYSRPHPPLLVGGGSRAAARRAARLGLPFFPSSHQPALETYYHARRKEYGTSGWCLMPARRTVLLHLSEDPERCWATYGRHLLHEARARAVRQPLLDRTAARAAVRDMAALRRQGVYRIMTPEQCVALALAEAGRTGLVLHPLCGGMPVAEGQRSLRLFAQRVLPRLATRTGRSAA